MLKEHCFHKKYVIVPYGTIFATSVTKGLINLMKDQVHRLSLLGVSATSLSDIRSSAEIKKVESGEFSIVYGSPESWLGEIRWRRMLASETYKSHVRAVAVDEAHVICHW